MSSTEINYTYPSEDFVPCTCPFCLETRLLAREFDKMVPKTNLQRRMKNIVKKIEKAGSGIYGFPEYRSDLIGKWGN